MSWAVVGRSLCRIAVFSGILVALTQAASFAQVSGVKTIGPWAVVTHDKANGHKDVAAIVSGKKSSFGLAIRCIDAKLSIALVPLKDEGLFGATRRSATLSLQPDAHPSSAIDGVVGDDHAIHLPSPTGLLKLVLATARLVVSVPAADGNAVSATFDLTASRRALADLVQHCPGG